MANLFGNIAPFRPTKETENLAGIGGFMQFSWGDKSSDAVVKNNILRWQIDHEYINARLPMTGGMGSISYRRVADDFTFVVLMNLNLRPMRGSPSTAPGRTSFVDGQLEGAKEQSFLISVRWQCGDPTFWTHPGHGQSIFRHEAAGRGLYYYCDSVILDRVVAINSARGQEEEGVVTYVVQGHGSAPLRRYVNDKWLGAGAFGLAREIQHHENNPLRERQ